MASEAPSRKDNAIVARRETIAQKRAQVQVACESCRQKKTKCDARRPCSSCTSRHTPCNYKTQVGETYAQASKRKLEEVSSTCENYEDLFKLIKTGNERDIAEIVRRIRRGHDPEAIVRYMATSSATFVATDPCKLALETFLINLAHSTGPLHDVVRLAMDSTTLIQLPDPREFNTLRNRIVYLPYLESMLQKSSMSADNLLASNSGPTNVSSLTAHPHKSNEPKDGPDDEPVEDQCPPHYVTAAPWTNITTSDEAVSHLVSVFLIWINPTWRFVEADLFLLGMRSRRPNSDFCSPLLVNSICAIASLQSEHRIAFAQGDDRITRGQHFHDEAIRLCALEENRPSLTNMQALCVLGLDSNYRAKDRLGLTLVPLAVQFDKEVPVHGNPRRCAAQGVSERDFLRARLSAHWTAECTHIIMRIAFMSGATAEPRRSGVPDIEMVFTNTHEIWTGYPLTRSATRHWPTLYLIERCKLAGIFGEIHSLIFARDEKREGTMRSFAKAVGILAARMQCWYTQLPEQLQYHWPMSIAVWELHASYHAVRMILHLAARSQLQQSIDEPQDPIAAEDAILYSQLAQDNLSTAILLAQRSAQTLREFRERYGLKITPAWLLQLQAVASNVLLLDPELANPSLTTSANSATSDGPIQSSHAAFDETFRCLLGTGVEVMIARAIARMTYHTTLKQRVVLSRLTWNMLQIMSDTAWRPSDISLVNSTFPNFAMINGNSDHDRLGELLSKWEAINID